VKPTAMLQDALIDLTYRGEIVLDPPPRLRVDSHRRREYRTGVLRHRARSTLRRCHYPTLSGGNGRCRYFRDSGGETFEKVAARRRNDESDERH